MWANCQVCRPGVTWTLQVIPRADASAQRVCASVACWPCMAAGAGSRRPPVPARGLAGVAGAARVARGVVVGLSANQPAESAYGAWWASTVVGSKAASAAAFPP